MSEDFKDIQASIDRELATRGIQSPITCRLYPLIRDELAREYVAQPELSCPWLMNTEALLKAVHAQVTPDFSFNHVGRIFADVCRMRKN